ncbi:MAG: hypothetical protein QCI82_03725 [Candidatus Thermoplasmatota archaeon]|nr:hypothetical protein [Candidatus Thermoplasmatota archaeon]
MGSPERKRGKVNSFFDRIALRNSARFVRIVRWLNRKFPERNIKTAVGIAVSLILTPPLFLLVTLLLLPFLIWDIFDPFGLDVPWLVYLLFLFLYACVGYLVYMFVEDALHILDVIYHPIKYLRGKPASVLTRPLRRILRKGGIYLGIVLVAIELILAIAMVVFGPTAILVFLMVIIALLFVTMILIGKFVMWLTKAIVNFLGNTILRSVDSRLRIKERLERYGSRVDDEIKRNRLEKKRKESHHPPKP